MASDQVTINDMQGVHQLLLNLNSTSKERPHPVDDLLRSATDMVDVQPSL